MTELAIDYSFEHPNPAAIKAAGVVGIMRYLSHDPDKDLTSGEAEALHAAGLWIGPNWETSQTRVNTGGVAGGTVDAFAANVKADALGCPGDCVIWYSCDTSPNLNAAIAYFTGVRSAHETRPIGWYGGMAAGLALKARGLVDFVWVANAASWSGYPHWDALAPVARANPNVSMLQTLTHELAGLDPSAYDTDEVLRPFPAWGRVVAPPVPAPKPIPPTNLGTPGETMSATRVVTMPLDDHGDGTVDVPGVKYEDRRAVTVDGLHNPPDKPVGYVGIPRVAFDEVTTVLRVVVEGGVPGGRYVILVAHA